MTDDLPSGRFVLRIDPGLHAALRTAAAAADLSLNEYCARKLAAPAVEVRGPLAEALARSVSAGGGALVGVVGFGSWARGEMTDDSDVDLLVVLERSLPISRGLYRAWDRNPLWWEGHRVEPQFVHLPSESTTASGLWAEAAADGIVVFDPVLRVSRWLGVVRRQIAEGRIVRHEADGQPYWVEAA